MREKVAAAGSAGRRWWTLAVALVALALAGFLLSRTLGRYSLDEILASLASFPTERLLSAAAFAAASYLCLTGFDYLALRYVKHPLPYPKAALTSFVALSLGHNIGFAALSSGTIRYRFYSRWGLEAEEIVKLILFCGTTVGLGLTVLGGFALLLRTDLAAAFTGLSPPLVIATGIACLLAAAAYLALAALVTRTLRIRGWTLEMPPFHLAAAQIAIGAANFACVAACLHQALAAAADVAYLGVVSVYVIANVAALVTHVPGGLGVIEAVVVWLLPHGSLIASLLVFRFVYFLAPLGIGACLFAISELALRTRR